MSRHLVIKTDGIEVVIVRQDSSIVDIRVNGSAASLQPHSVKSKSFAVESKDVGVLHLSWSEQCSRWTMEVSARPKPVVKRQFLFRLGIKRRESDQEELCAVCRTQVNFVCFF